MWRANSSCKLIKYKMSPIQLFKVWRGLVVCIEVWSEYIQWALRCVYQLRRDQLAELHPGWLDARRHHCLSQTFTDNRCLLFEWKLTWRSGYGTREHLSTWRTTYTARGSSGGNCKRRSQNASSYSHLGDCSSSQRQVFVVVPMRLLQLLVPWWFSKNYKTNIYLVITQFLWWVFTLFFQSHPWNAMIAWGIIPAQALRWPAHLKNPTVVS